MQSMSAEEVLLSHELVYQPSKFANRFTDAADRYLRRVLFRALTRNRDDYLRLLFPGGPPLNDAEVWRLRTAQGAVDGAEYTEAARGTTCGHIFKNGENTYHCKTCAADDTCVLCARCFEAGDHEGHAIFVSVSPGNSGCCDCGDKEAWKRDGKCTIHSLDALPQGSSKSSGKARAAGGNEDSLPDDFVDSIRMTIARVADYLCDVFSCSPEQLRLPKTVDTVRQDELQSRLGGVYGEEPLEEETEYSLLLWNDEKHTVDDVQNQVARACRKTKKFGLERAMEVNDIGRSIVQQSTDIAELLRMAEIIEQLKLTVTIRSSRDTFREQMCATMIDWIADISGCSVGKDSAILRKIVCEELLNPWRTGSRAGNKDIGQEGIDDHEMEDQRRDRRRYRLVNIPLQQGGGVVLEIEQNDDDDGGAEDDVEEEDDDGMDMDDDDTAFDVLDIGALAQVAMDASLPDADMDDVEQVDADEAASVGQSETSSAGAARHPSITAHTARHRQQAFTPAESDDGGAEHQAAPNLLAPYEIVPKTPKVKSAVKRTIGANKPWLGKPAGFKGPRPSEPCEDLWQRVRLDFLILYDLRLWKILRINLRHLYITTVVTIPHFRRILGLRFAGLYTTLAQLYLIADREPDHSIINLSVQMLTTPTITHEVVERGNFLTNLMAILYTFLTTRQVGFPEDVSPRATLAFDAGAVTNRRIFHFFLDLRWLFHSEFILHCVRVEPRYLLQFLDLVKLHQGVCPNVRATAEHVEYESDAWLSVSPIVKEINKLCRQLAVAFESKAGASDGNVHLQRAIRAVAQVAMFNAFGYERQRFAAAELKDDLGWHSVGPFEDSGKTYSVPKHVVQTEPMSFHHPLHYMLSWLIENAKTVSRESMRALLHFQPEDLKDPWNAQRAPSAPDDLTADELLCSIFDHPLRVCVWLAQMKTNMWVRNGITLRHQANTYRSVAYRDVGYQRDLFMVQVALVLCGSDAELPGERFLAQTIDRFQMTGWFQGNYAIVPGFEERQQIDVLEDFFHLLVVALSERGNLTSDTDEDAQQDAILRHDIAHALCFKPLSFSDLAARVTEKVGESDDFDRVLESMTTYRAPEGLNDTGTFELKPEYIDLIDPYYAHYSRNLREEAEQILMRHMASKAGKKMEDMVYEPRLQTIQSGLFKDLAAFTRTPLFAQVIAVALNFAIGAKTLAPNTQSTRIDTFLHVVLHLIMISTIEDESRSSGDGFVKLAATPQNFMMSSHQQSVVSALVTLSGMDDYASCHATIKAILRKMQMRQPDKLSVVVGPLGALLDRAESGSPASLSADDKERKKAEALARQARVMAKMKEQQNSFLQNQGLSGFTDSYDDLDNMSITDEPANIETNKTWDFPTGTCIWCQEEADDQRLYGTFAFLGESDILRSTPVSDVDYIREVIDTPSSLDRPADHIRPFGVAGRNQYRSVTPGTTTEKETHELPKGFPHEHTVTRGPVATSCGHIMHYGCFELYLAHIQRRHSQQIARNHAETMELKEFTCPLCKALGNTFFPIIWKTKICAQDHEVHAAPSFPDWLLQRQGLKATDLPFLEGSGTESFRQLHAMESLSNQSVQYVSEMCVPPLTASMGDLSLGSPPRSSSHFPQLGRRFFPSSLGFTQLLDRGRHDGSSSSTDSAGVTTPADMSQRVAELAKAYFRLDETVRTNALAPDGETEKAATNPVQPLSRALGLSISAFEIAHRGSGSQPHATSLLADLSEQTATQLRILAESIQSYLAIRTLGPPVRGHINREMLRKQEQMVAQLFGIDDTEVAHRLPAADGNTLFEEDIFLFFVDWLSFMMPDVAEASNVLRLCYWAEVVKVTVIYERVLEMQKTAVNGDGERSSTSTGFGMTLDEALAGSTRNAPGLPSARVRELVEKYAATFLRKSIVAMHVRYGLDFECPYDLDPELPELQRLTALLHLPSLAELNVLHTAPTPSGDRLRHFTRQWLGQAHAATALQPGGIASIPVAHPAIFELVGLPKNYDALVERAARGRCPTTGKDMTDPVICLVCGDMFCSQAVCCSVNRRGGCQQHMARHRARVGLFLCVRKCYVFFLHGTQHGSFVLAPYLDRHGEPDPSLRRRHQLFLHARRYDKLMRDVWLLHQIPTVISRKLEADTNPGGWESL